jgi:hypothetical protein
MPPVEASLTSLASLAVLAAMARLVSLSLLESLSLRGRPLPSLLSLPPLPCVGEGASSYSSLNAPPSPLASSVRLASW